MYGIEEYVVPSNITGISHYCFGKSSIPTVQETIKSIVIPSSVTTLYGYEGVFIGDGFYNCISLTSVTMADSVVSGYTTAMFYGCSSLKEVRVSSGLTSWNTEMFCGCSSLSSLTIPSSVTSIGVNGYWNGMSRSHSSFSGCTALTSITAVSETKPTIVVSTTFEGIATGGTLYHPENSDYTLWLSGSPHDLGYYLWNDAIDFTLENVSTYYMQFASIASGSGYSQSVFITANKPDYQVTISAQQDVTGTGVSWLSVSGTPSTGYTEFKVYPTTSAETQRMCWIQVSYKDRIYATITVVQEGANSSGITSDASVVLSYRFAEQQQDDTYITNIQPTTAKVDGTVVSLTYKPHSAGILEGYYFLFPSGNHTVELYYSAGTTGASFSSQFELIGLYIFKDVVSISPYFGGYELDTTQVEHIYLWSGFTGFSTNGYTYFGATPKLTSFEGDSPLISFDKRIVVWNDILCGFAPLGLTSYAFPNAITGISNVFGYNYGAEHSASTPCSTSITGITLPNNLIYFSARMDNMTGLKSIYIPDSVVGNLNYGANHNCDATFANCTSLTQVYISSGLTKFNSLHFLNCISLTSVTFGNTDEIVLGGTFAGCTSLPTITLPKLGGIGSSTFAGCTSLTSITFDTIYNDGLSGNNAIFPYTFSGCTALSDIYFLGTGITTTSQGMLDISTTAFIDVRPNGTFHYKYNSNPGNIMSNNAYYLGYYGWTAVNDIP